MDPFDITTLTQLVVARAKVDKSELRTDNLRAGWQTDELIGHIDFAVVGAEQYGVYADFGRLLDRALIALNLPDPTVLAELAIVRGERLLPLTEKRIEYIQAVADSIYTKITVMPPGTRRLRCESLFDYQMGIFADAACDFDRAIKLHTKETLAADAAGDKVRAAIASFQGAYVILKLSLYKNDVDEARGTDFLALKLRFDSVVMSITGTPHETQWLGNAARIMSLASIWLQRTNAQEFRAWAQQAIAAATKLGSAWSLGGTFLSAVLSDDTDKIREVANTAGTGDTNEIIATARLLLVRSAIAEDDHGKAKNLLKDMPTQQVAHIVALAEREATAAQQQA